jgi:hypothetical protein
MKMIVRTRHFLHDMEFKSLKSICGYLETLASQTPSPLQAGAKPDEIIVISRELIFIGAHHPRGLEVEPIQCG